MEKCEKYCYRNDGRGVESVLVCEEGGCKRKQGRGSKIIMNYVHTHTHAHAFDEQLWGGEDRRKIV